MNVCCFIVLQGSFFNAKMHLSSPVAWAVVRSKAVVLLFVDFLFIVTPIVGVCNYTPFTKYIGGI